MSDHDPICTRFRRAVDEPFQPCICGEIREARVDERGVMLAAHRYERADLRAKVETLETFHNMIWKQDVLALFDGPGDA